jgi:hypothetical protein
MIIKRATKNDISKMVKIDKKVYGKYGANKEYISKKMKSFPQGALVVKNNNKITGFIICEIIGRNEIPEDFYDMKVNEPFQGKWMHPVMFTTETNYKNKVSDSKLLITAEKIAKKFGCIESCVPLSKNHPFIKNRVFEFWKMNGYKNIGKIKWSASEYEFIECYLYKKKF